MKKIICAVLVLTMTVCLFAACGKKDKTEETKPTATTDADYSLRAKYFNEGNTEAAAEGISTTDAKDNENAILIQMNGETTYIVEGSTPFNPNGIEMDYYSRAPRLGETAAVRALGTANAEFSVKIYNEDGTEFIKIDNVKSGEDGVIKFSFTVPDNAKAGEKLMVIREVGTDNYLSAPVYVLDK